MLTAIIPARNEVYLQNTIDSLLENANGEIEVIVILDGYWSDPPLKDDKRVVIIHNSQPRGMRAGINDAVAIAKSDYILKSDAHCMFAKGFDEVLLRDCKENQVMVPRRLPLDPIKWEIEERKDNKYPIDYMYLDETLHGREWREKRDDSAHKDLTIDDLMTSQGSCWFMFKKLFNKLELLDDVNYGTFFNEFQEIGLKAWLSGNEVKINKNTWYAHWHKNEGRGYHLPGDEQIKGQQQTDKWLEFNKAWDKQIHPIEWLFEKFNINLKQK